MKFISAPKEPVRVKLARERTRMLKQGYPWIYRDWLIDTPDAPVGSRVLVRDKDGTPIAFGMYDPLSPLVVRAVAHEHERLDDDLVQARLDRALTLRRALFDRSTTGYRLLNGEGDGLPGIVCDRYGDHAVIKLDGDGPAAFWNLDGFVEWLGAAAGITSVFLKYRSEGGEGERGEMLRGTLPTAPIPFVENGLAFEADIVHGQKTGFFFDQRDNRQRIRGLAEKQTVLNLFGYTGGFSIYAGAGRARQVTTVDIAKPAIVSAERNWGLNRLGEGRHEGVAADVFEFLEVAAKERRRWDLVIVDPPSFAPAERHVEKATASYQALFASALRVLREEGIIALSSCSSHISPELFLEICRGAVSKARRRATVIGSYGQPEDHPFPLAGSELQYLKFVMLVVR